MAGTAAYFSVPAKGLTIMIEFLDTYDEVEVVANLSVKLGSIVVPITEEEYRELRQEADDEQQACRVCGCTWENACPGGCYWVEDDLCSVCARA